MESLHREALIGHTGFVGSNLAAQHAFSDIYNSQNIEEIKGGAFDLIVCAGAPGVKWRANKEPEADWQSITQIMNCLETVKTKKLILASSLNVYPEPRGVDEDTVIDANMGQPYGRHRNALERFVAERFADYLIVRMPGIFGPGLKKNVLFDLIHGDDTFLAQTHVDSIVQFYDLRHAWADIQKAQTHGLSLINLTSEPMKLMDISRECFGRDFPGRTDGPVYHDDMRTKYGALWGKQIPYLYTKEEVMADLKAFIASST